MRKLFVLIVLILTGIAAYLWFSPTEPEDTLLTDQELIPDYIAEQVSRILFDEQGNIADQVQAERLEHFETLGFTQFEKPTYTLYTQNNQPAWQASSQYAVWFPEDRIILDKQVNIINLQQDELIEKIETVSLEMLFPDNKLQTDQPVRLLGKGFYINGVGMRADLTEKTMLILQHQETVYLNEN
ncbi:LPS export ABC transporter periplasmic protein LptC [Chromatiaceae bacterium AAb-1]|nr:LPS export ABC transporter periplasmic protein LptC [Chromatiaceae bacterium AAb-1]